MDNLIKVIPMKARLALATVVILSSCVSEKSGTESPTVVDAQSSSPTIPLPNCTREEESRSVQAYCLFNSAALLLSNGYPDIAKLEFLRVIELDSANFDAYLSLGDIYFKEGDLENAEKMYVFALKLAPNNFLAHLNLGVVYDNIGSLEQAINSYKAAINLNPESANSYYNLGLAYAKDVGLLDQAIQSFEMAVKLDPEYSATYFNLGQIHEYQRRRAAALVSYRKAAALGHAEAEERITLIR